MNDYILLDSGNHKKLEQFGDYLLIRPCPQAIWPPASPKLWAKAHDEFDREKEGKWKKKSLPSSWVVDFNGIKLKLSPTNFGHIGLFPEHSSQWNFLEQNLKKSKLKVLNLFAYSGAATLFLAKQGVDVCHLDASKGMVKWARENAVINNLEKAPIRWIIDDAIKFLKRESKRNNHYDGILLDPPTYGRGSQGQVFKIEEDILLLLSLVKEVLTKEPSFVLLTAHTPGFTPLILEQLMVQFFKKGKIESGEMTLSSTTPLPSGAFVRWVPHV